MIHNSPTRIRNSPLVNSLPYLQNGTTLHVRIQFNEAGHDLTFFSSPYAVGKKIDLLIHGGITARATILHVYEPFNSACTMNLLFDSDLTYLGIQGKVVLKLFDRRYATTLRRTSGTIPWSPAFETRYARMITDGTPAVVQSHLIKRLKAFDNNP